MSSQKIMAKITGVGMSVPERRLTNADLEKMVETSDEWITKRVGIKERRVAAEGEYTSHFGIKAAQAALDMAGVSASEIDLILVGTSTADTIYPSVACLIQKAIGATRAGVLDISAACTGFIYGLSLANGMIRSGLMKHVLVVASEVNTSVVNWKDRDTCILFGDGAGAAVISASTEGNSGVLSSTLGGDGNYDELLYMTNSGCRNYPDVDGRYIIMQGNEVFKLAVRNMTECAVQVLKQAELTADDVNLLIPHQANTRIIGAVSSRLGIPDERVFVNIAKYGNTSAASIPIALCEAVHEGRLNSGDILVIDAFGAGLTWGAMAIRW